MKVAIIGAGPAGLLAAWGATRYISLASVTIYDPDPTYRPERILPLQYLHDTCGLKPDALKPLTIDYEITGIDPNLKDQVGLQKAAKFQYNAKLNRPLSEENSTRYAFQDRPDIYSLRTAYTWLHGFFAERMVTLALTWDQIVNDLPNDYDRVISTAPLPKLLPDWSWPTIDMWITPDYLPVEVRDGLCILNVDPKVGWTRATSLDGGKATEWCKIAGEIFEFNIGHVLPYALSLRKIVPPPKLPELPDKVYLAGRWGSWDAGILTHHAYYRARNIMDGPLLK